jgi:hypothetical protein
MYDAQARISALLSLVAISIVSAAARADQVVVADVTYTHSADNTDDSHYRIDPKMGSPADWSSPVDFTKGSVHILVEVKTKPGATPTKFQVCFEGDPTYACTDQSPTYTETGEQEWNSPFSRFWVPANATMNWKNGIDKIALILKDTNNMPREEADYLPTELRVEIALLTQGETYTPTSGEDEEDETAAPPPRAGSPAAAGRGGAEAGSGGRAASGAAGSPAPDAEAAGAAGASAPANPSSPRATGLAGARAPAAGAGSAGTGGARSSLGAGGAAGGGSRSDANSQDFQYPSGNESGCSVLFAARESAGQHGATTALLVALGLLVTRQRRRSGR